MGAISDLHRNFRVWALLFTQIRNNHLYNLALIYNLALSSPLVVRGRLRVHVQVQRDPAIRVSPTLLYGFTSSPFAFSSVPKECRKACQPMFLWMPSFRTAGLMYRFIKLCGQYGCLPFMRGLAKPQSSSMEFAQSFLYRRRSSK